MLEVAGFQWYCATAGARHQRVAARTFKQLGHSRRASTSHLAALNPFLQALSLLGCTLRLLTRLRSAQRGGLALGLKLALASVIPARHPMRR